MIASPAVVPLVGDPLGDAPLGAALSDELQRKFLVWDAFVGGRRRVDVHPLLFSRTIHDHAVRVAESVARAIDDVADRAFDDENEAALYRFHPDVLRLARASWKAGDRSSLVRVDLLLGEDDRFHACEVNADCPGGHNEASALPHLARRAGFLDGVDPSRVVDALVAELSSLASVAPGAARPDASRGAVALVYATAFAEDLQVCAFLQRALLASGVESVLVSPTSFVFRDGVLFAAGVPVRAIYRFFPSEWMPGMRSVGALEEAIAAGAVKTISSFSRMFAQSKLSFARATAMRSPLVGNEIAETFVVDDVGRDRLLAERSEWVLKRALGRVGDQVFVGELCDEPTWRSILDHVRLREEDGGPWLAQRRVRQRTIPTPFGDRYLTLGGYVLDGRFVGWFARVTSRPHVSHDALCVPVFVERGGAA